MTSYRYHRVGITLSVALAILALALSSCKGKKGLGKVDLDDDVTARMLYDSVESRQPVYTWYSASGKMRAQTDEIAFGFTIRLRMLRDSAIWLRAEKLGFEVGRALIRPDSAFILDRFNREYYVEPIDEFLEEYNIPFSFQDLQRLLAGGTVALKPQYLRSELDEGQMRLTCNAGEIKAIYWLDQLYRIDKGRLVDLYGRNADIRYADYRFVSDLQEIPFERYLSFFDGTANTELTMQLTEIELDVPQSLKFTVPGNYERVD